jgi:hypothetical protein|nr:MAG TPA: Terminase small subunit [Caudoviricetes sp.]
MATDKLAATDKPAEIAKPKRKRNRPDLANFGQEHIEPGDNARYLRNAMVAWDLPPIDISDARQVEHRIQEYFEFCINQDAKPSVPGMGLWLGVDASTVARWRRGDYREQTHRQVIKKAMQVLEMLWNDWMQSGKINPASGIFIGKNMFGYKDTQDVVLSPHNLLDDGASPDAIADKYRDALPDADVLPDDPQV